MTKIIIEKMNSDYEKKYNVLHGASFSSITAYQEQANVAITALLSNLDGIKSALGREETWDDTTCSKLIESFDTSNTEVTNALAAIEGKCPGAVAALDALASKLDDYKTAYDAYKDAATSYNTTEGGEPSPKTQTVDVFDKEGKKTGTKDVETELHSKWAAELASKETTAKEAATALKTADDAVAAAITAALGALA